MVADNQRLGGEGLVSLLSTSLSEGLQSWWLGYLGTLEIWV